MCSGCGNCVVQFHTKPLSSYVMLSFLLSMVSGFAAYSAYSKEDGCKFKEDAAFGLSTFCFVLLGTAIVNVVFALYFQNRVWKQIKSKIKEDQENNYEQTLEIKGESYSDKMKKAGGGLLQQGAAMAGRQDMAGNAPAEAEDVPPETQYMVIGKVVQDAFKQTFMEDFGVLIFFLASLGIAAMCYMAKGYIEANEPTCKPQEMEGWAYWTGFGFFTVPFIYTLMWYCCTCCAKAANITQEEADKLLEEGGRGDFQRVAQDSEGQ